MTKLNVLAPQPNRLCEDYSLCNICVIRSFVQHDVTRVGAISQVTLERLTCATRYIQVRHTLLGEAVTYLATWCRTKVKQSPFQWMLSTCLETSPYDVRWKDLTPAPCLLFLWVFYMIWSETITINSFIVSVSRYWLTRIKPSTGGTGVINSKIRRQWNFAEITGVFIRLEDSSDWILVGTLYSALDHSCPRLWMKSGHTPAVLRFHIGNSRHRWKLCEIDWSQISFTVCRLSSR